MYHKTEQEIIQNWKGDISKPVVSICCTTYNHEPYIAEAIEGFLMQETDFPFEILIRDDASTDKTAKIIREYAEKYPTLIKPVFEKENTYSKGVKPFPRLYKIAKGEYIALCEGDDYWTDTKKLERQIGSLRKYTNYSLSFNLSAELIDNTIHFPHTNNSKIFYSVQDIIQSDFHFIQTNTIVFKRKALNNLNFDLLGKSPVGDVWTRIAAAIPNGAICINSVMGVYRVQSKGSWSETIQKDNLFIDYINKMLLSIDQFDAFWNFMYNKEFKKYKNKFIMVVLKKKSFNKKVKCSFIKKYWKSVSLSIKLKWFLICKSLFLLNSLKLLNTKVRQIIK